MQRLHSNEISPEYFSIENQPENCSLLFLLQQEKSIILVDELSNPKLLVVTYPEIPPSLWFVTGKIEHPLVFRNFIQKLHQQTDLVIPKTILNQINRYWPVQFCIPILFLAADANWLPTPPSDFRVRLLTSKDAFPLETSFKNYEWLWEFFGSAEGLVKYGQAAAAFIGGELVCAATTLAFTDRYCEIGVATHPEFRGRGLALECCRALTQAQYERFGRLPCWRTNSSNVGSWKLARNLGLKETPGSEEFFFISNYRHVGVYATVAP